MVTKTQTDLLTAYLSTNKSFQPGLKDLLNGLATHRDFKFKLLDDDDEIDRIELTYEQTIAGETWINKFVILNDQFGFNWTSWDDDEDDEDEAIDEEDQGISIYVGVESMRKRGERNAVLSNKAPGFYVREVIYLSVFPSSNFEDFWAKIDNSAIKSLKLVIKENERINRQKEAEAKRLVKKRQTFFKNNDLDTSDERLTNLYDYFKNDEKWWDVDEGVVPDKMIKEMFKILVVKNDK